MERAYLLDEIIDVMEDLNQKEVLEGWNYNEWNNNGDLIVDFLGRKTK
jgi:hypothetical protein